MRKIFLLLLSLLFAVAVFAQTPAAKPKQLTERQKAIGRLRRSVEFSSVIESLKKWNIKIRRNDGKRKPMSAIQYSAFCNTVQTWLKYRWFIADSGLSRKWLRNIHELLIYMQKTRSYLQAAEFNGWTKTAQYRKALEYFDVAHKRFAKSIDKPVKVSGKVRRKAQRKRILWERAMREKYKIKQKF